ncbi:glycosyltransferase family 2 protein [Glycomyces terrestris]|uniref:Glycosyltransferase family 2 protein n=1 Tax=Glycomyces terrestris TaxID=2493553 RepID=A0A426USN4_9ACTN|nr:glycosyltransferase family 2 protein [Glycomyces terrestris]RRR96462.1 glycosyltransferase family 2 protein [Glycomyces terrestris]
MSLSVLAYLAYPTDPDVFWRSVDRFPQLSRVPLNLEALCALAAGLVLQPRGPEDVRRGTALFDLAHRRLGGGLDPAHQDLHVIAAHLSGDAAKTRRLLGAYRDCTPALRGAIASLAAHPANGGGNARLERELQALSGWEDLRLPADPARATIDNLTTTAKAGWKNGPLISVVMTCFQPGPALLTAVRSIQAQSWKRWELFVVDDASGPEYADVLREVGEIDPRVTVLVQPENGGTYKARNRAITAANGAFITGLDSDDWAHPRRLERQVRPMLKDPRLVAVESCALSTTTDLRPVVDPQVDVIAARSTLVMFRTEPIREHIGFYDEVRKNGDSEFIRRIRSRFGPRSWTRVTTRPMTIMRREGETLSAGEISRAWMSAGRFAYHSAFMHWHRQIKAKAEPAFLDSLPVRRPFPLSVSLTLPGAEATFTYDRVYAADWRLAGRTRSAMLDEAVEAAANGERVALAHCPEWLDVNGRRALIPEYVLKIAAEHGLCFTDIRPGVAPSLVAPTPEYLELLRFEHPEIDGADVRVVEPGEEPRAERRRPPAPAVRPLLRRRDRLLVGLGVPAAGAAALASVWTGPEPLWVLAGGAAAAAAVAGLGLSRQLSRRLHQR